MVNRSKTSLLVFFALFMMVIAAFVIWLSNPEIAGVQTGDTTPLNLKQQQSNATKSWQRIGFINSKLGLCSEFEVNYHSALLISASVGTKPVFSIGLAGTWNWCVVVSDSESYVIHALFDNVSIDANNQNSEEGQVAASDSETIADDLANALLIKYDKAGLITEVAYPQEMTSMGRTILRSMVSYVQLALPEPGKVQWNAKEIDSTGFYLAEYKTARDKIEKTKIRYLSVHNVEMANRLVHATIQSSQINFGLQLKKGRQLVDTISAVESVSIDKTDFLPETSARMKFSLNLRRSYAMANVDSLLDQTATSRFRPLEESPAIAENGIEMDRVRAAGASYQDLMTQLDENADNKDKKSAVSQKATIFQTLASVFRLDDSAIDLARQAVQSNSAHAPFLIDTLAFAGNENAQKALMELIENGPKEYNFRIFRGLGFSRKPIEENIALHNQLVSDELFGKQAQYGLGNHVSSLQKSNRALADELFGQLEERLVNANSFQDKVVAIRALGNSNHPSLGRVITPHLRDGETTIRNEAMKALSRVPGEDIEQMLAERALTDPDKHTRVLAISSLGARTPSSTVVGALETVIKVGGDAYLRKYAVSSLLRLKRTNQIANLLEWISTNETDADIKKMLEVNYN